MPEDTSPSMKYRLAKMKSTRSGKAPMTYAANCGPYAHDGSPPTVFVRLCASFTGPTVITCRLSSVMATVGQLESFQINSTEMIMYVYRIGSDSGMQTRK